MNKINLLLVEDDKDMCEELRGILENEGCSVEMAHDGKTGKRIIENGKHEIILLDLKLPNITGYELLEYIKTRYPSKRVLVLTGKPLSMDTSRDRTLIDHFPYDDSSKNYILKLADDIINKPFDIEELISKIKKLSQKRD